MKPQIGKTYLVTTDNWFYAPDGNTYKAVWGTLHAMHSDEETIGFKAQRPSRNWYMNIGNVLIAGCQIHYAIQCDKPAFKAPIQEATHEGKLVESTGTLSRIYNANVS